MFRRKSSEGISFHQTDVFAVLIIGGIWIYFRGEIGQKVDELCLSLFGKNLSGRNLAIQIAVYAFLTLLSLLIPLLLRRLMKRKPEFRYAADVMLLLMLAVPAGQLLVICANQVLRRDDYWEIADARQYGFPGSIFFEIQRYNGRYTGWGLRSLHALLPSIPYINIFLFLNLILLTAGTGMLCARLLKAQTGLKETAPGMRLRAFVMGFGLALAYVLLSSNIFEFWFWGSGTMIYGLGVSLCVLSIALAWNAAEAASLRSSRMILPCLSCFLTCGCTELCTASLAAFLVLLLLWLRIRSGKWNSRVLILIGVVLLCCVLIFTTSASLDFSGTSGHIEGEAADFSAAGLSARLKGIFDWAFHGLQGYTFVKAPTLILFLLTAFLSGTQMRFEKRTRIRLLILAVLLTVIAHGVLMINTMVDYMPPRVITVGICWYFTAMALVCVLLGSFFCPGEESHSDRVKLLLCALLFMIVVNEFYSENIGELRTIRGSWIIRDRLLQLTADSETPMVTCSLPSPGSSKDDITPDPRDDFNIGTALYYRVPEISAEVRCPPWGEFFLPEDPYAEPE